MIPRATKGHGRDELYQMPNQDAEGRYPARQAKLQTLITGAMGVTEFFPRNGGEMTPRHPPPLSRVWGSREEMEFENIFLLAANSVLWGLEDC